MRANKYFKKSWQMLIAAMLALLIIAPANNVACAQSITSISGGLVYQFNNNDYGQVITFDYNPPNFTSTVNCLGYTPQSSEPVVHYSPGSTNTSIDIFLSGPVTSLTIPVWGWRGYHTFQLLRNGQMVYNQKIIVSQPSCATNFYMSPIIGVKQNDAIFNQFTLTATSPEGFNEVLIDGGLGLTASTNANNCYLMIPRNLSWYGVNACNAGTSQVSLSAGTLSNVCPAPLANLNTLVTSSTPANTNLVWYTTPDHSGNPVGDPTAVPLGTYYAFYYDPINFCFNTNASTAKVVVSQTICNTNTASGTIDCSKTQLYPAPIAGIPSQIDLIVTINVATAGCFTPITAGGSGFSITPGFTQKCVTSTGIQQLHIPVNYDGSTLGILNFTVGSAGSCTADLTKEPKDKIVKLWTLDNCIPMNAGPTLK